MPCSLCGEERCDCISSVLDALEPPAPRVPASSGRASTSAVAQRPEPPPLPVWSPPPPPPPPWNGWSPPGFAPGVLWRGGAPGLYVGRRRYDLLAADDRIALVPAGASMQRSLVVFGLAGATIGGSMDRTQGDARMRQLLAAPPPAIFGAPGVRVVAREEVEAVRVVTSGSTFTGGTTGTARVQLRHGADVKVRWTRQPHGPGLLQATFGGLATVAPRPLWNRAARGAGLVLAIVFLFVVLGLAAWAVAGDVTPVTPSNPGSSAAPSDVLERRAHSACLMADAAFDAPPERLGLELGNAADAMFGAAEIDGRYRQAGLALVWFRDHTVNGQFTASEAEAEPYLAALDQACADHLANTPSTTPSF